jgi:hypothetical protein
MCEEGAKERPAKEVQVADRVEKLVTDELVGEFCEAD